MYIDVGREKNTYIFAKGYKYFFLIICKVTTFIFSKFIKKKSKLLLVFIVLVTFLERQYNIKVFILFTDFREYNLVTIKAYFAQKKIK